MSETSCCTSSGGDSAGNRQNSSSSSSSSTSIPQQRHVQLQWAGDALAWSRILGLKTRGSCDGGMLLCTQEARRQRPPQAARGACCPLSRASRRLLGLTRVVASRACWGRVSGDGVMHSPAKSESC
jgi:hypothetical protein